MLFGPYGSGKTHSIIGLLLRGLKVVVISTDVGGSGLLTVKVPLRRMGRTDLLANLREVLLYSDEEIKEFCTSPTIYFPDIYDFNPDVLVWEGFSAWQQVELSEKIGNMPVESKHNELSLSVAEGLRFETPQWGMLRNATFRGMDKFCSMHDPRTGKIWHKVVTCQEGVKSKPKVEGSNTVGGLIDTYEPLLQGAGGVLISGAFDLIIRTKEKKGVDEKGNPATEYIYQIRSENARQKVRGIDLPAVMPADMYKLWGIIAEQAGIAAGAVDENLKEAVNEV